MYQAFIHGFPVFLSMYQSGFYNLFSAEALRPYLDAWAIVHGPKENA